jgi:two-component system, sensor histidine kinase and response regulator
VILVADDDQVNQIVAAGMLEAIGYQSQLVDDGVEVVAAIEQATYAAVLMDCQMPRLDGYEATRAIRRREQGGTHVPIIALTAFSLPGGRETCLAAGMDDYLTKPITITILREALARNIDTPSDPVE